MKDSAYRLSCVSLPRMVLITMSVITMHSISHKLASDCLSFAKFPPQFCESCGVAYRRICEMFSALQSTPSPVIDVENSVQIDAQLAMLSLLKLVRN